MIYSSDGEVYEDATQHQLDVSKPSKSGEAPITPSSEDVKSTTHKSEQENPAEPIIKGITDFYHGGLHETLKQQGVQFPDWVNKVGDIINNPNAQEALGLFGGVSKFGKLAAETLEKTGMEAARIKRLTGLERGAEGMWRKEIDDSKSKILNWESTQPGQSHKLGDILEHPELYAKYPELKDLQVNLKDMGDPRYNTLGYYHMEQKYGSYTKPASMEINTRVDSEKARAVVLHEIQHAIQEKEGFAGRYVLNNKEKNDQILGHVIRNSDPEDLKKFLATAMKAIESGNKTAEYLVRDTAEKILKRAEYEKYFSEATEQEAFNTENRLHMSDTSRRKSLGSSTEKVPRSKQYYIDQNKEIRKAFE